VRESAPGPGQYSPTSPEKQNYKFTMGAKGSSRLTPRDDGPGPGAYSLQTSIGEDKKYSLYGRHKTPRGEEGPGNLLKFQLINLFRSRNVLIEN
jgi:hypothetical protein